MLNSSSAFWPCVARKVPRMTLRVVEALLPSDDDRINGFGTLVLPDCRMKNPYLTTVAGLPHVALLFLPHPSLPLHIIL